MTTPIRTDFIPSRALDLDRTTRSLGPAETGDKGFSDVFKKLLNDTGDMQDQSKNLIGAFLRGEPVEMHQVMAASEEAQISLELLVELRNKLTDAYRSIMNLQ
jgi:flagellar hook-basal body complex protein FliE